MKIIGIDPGLNGAIAILEDNKVLSLQNPIREGFDMNESDSQQVY